VTAAAGEIISQYTLRTAFNEEPPVLKSTNQSTRATHRHPREPVQIKRENGHGPGRPTMRDPPTIHMRCESTPEPEARYRRAIHNTLHNPVIEPVAENSRGTSSGRSGMGSDNLPSSTPTERHPTTNNETKDTVLFAEAYATPS
jgi:hypothetical protein